jgi:cobalt-zinc-cadmium efflux system membrane fusion protein
MRFGNNNGVRLIARCVRVALSRRALAFGKGFVPVRVAARGPVLLIALLVLAGCSHDSSAPAEGIGIAADAQGIIRVPESSALRKRLAVQAVDVKDSPHALVIPADVEADPTRVLSILSPLTGRVTALNAGLGDIVSKGETLAVIASGDLAQAYSDEDKARDALDLAHKALERAKGVADAGAAAVKDLESAQSGYTQALAEFDRADTRLKSLGGSSEKQGTARPMVVKAPAGGAITAVSVGVGSFINDSTASIMTLANIDTIWVTANVPEGDLGQIAKGVPVDVTLAAYPGEILHGKVQFVDAVLAADTRRDRVRIAFANPGAKLKPNMFATATFLLPQPRQVFVPLSAILMNNDSTTVLVEVAPWAFERRQVELGLDEGSDVRILKGLQPGERVVIKGGVLISD